MVQMIHIMDMDQINLLEMQKSNCINLGERRDHIFINDLTFMVYEIINKFKGIFNASGK